MVGKPDPWGTLFNSLAESLTRTRSGDPRDPDSVNTGILGRVSEGILKSSNRLSAADKENRKELLKLEDEFSKRRSAESEKEFEAEGEDFTRADERKALSLARKFKLEDKIIGLPYEKQKQAMAILLSKMTIKEKEAKINKLNAEAKAAGTLDFKTLKDIDSVLDNMLNRTIVSDGIVNGKISNEELGAAEKRLRSLLIEKYPNNPQRLVEEYRIGMENFQKQFAKK